ncbi:hypothetical protein GTP38_06940 [Duganella sp. FT94W]|uniref:Uncharacterized protein n=1 Tax=Duganella lactea TaxID=2692173 RepID=A0ABW9V5Q1_9BURK|nr:hypothetical protein [Duganella lactea]MYM34074.1 hypothetical protein [Duganella lactea]
MTVNVAKKIIDRRSSLSEITNHTLAYIDGGPQWLGWAMRNPMANYQLADEAGLLAEVQLGLHGSPMTLLPKLGLWVSPVKLMTLGLDNLRVLGQVETGDAGEVVAQQAHSILAANHLLTASQLGAVSDFLQQLGVQDAPVFVATDFNDRIALYHLAAAQLGQEANDAAQVCQQAAAWAIEQARTVAEFGDYYHFYLAYCKKVQALNDDVDTRTQLANQALQTLLPLAFGALEAPQLPDRLLAPAEVEARMHQLLTQGYKIGFSRLSQAVLQIVTNTIFTTEAGADAARLFELYMNAAQAFLTTNKLKDWRLEQDGASLSFNLQSADQQAQLFVNANRILSLRQFGALKNLNPTEQPS